MRISLLFVLLFFVSCHSVEHIERETRDTLTLVIRDTLENVLHKETIVHEKDSVIVREYMRGDTVFVERETYKERSKDSNNDAKEKVTRSEDKRETSIETRVEKEIVERELSWWEKTQMYIGDAAMLVFAIFVLVHITRNNKIRKALSLIRK